MERASESRENAVRQQLKSYDNGLDLRWFPAIRRYAIVAIWPLADSRRQLHQSGEFEDDCDILGWFAIDTADADTAPVEIDSMEKRLFEILNRSDNLKVPWKLRLKEMAENNKNRRALNKKEILDQVGEIAKDLEYMVGHNEEPRMRRIMADIAKEGLQNG